MNGLLRTVCLLLLALAAPMLGAQSLQWSLAIDALATRGDSRYLMEEPDVGVSSELVFPLNTVVAGLTVRGQTTGRRRVNVFEASLAVNLLSPFSLMQDYDWFMVAGVPKIPFSYTESDARMFWLTASAAWKPQLRAGQWGGLSAELGLRFQYLSQIIDGYNGWVYADEDPEDGQPELYHQYGTGTVLTYRVAYLMPAAGIGLRLDPLPGWSAVVQAGVMLGEVTDRDDHVLRYKLATAGGIGVGAYADVEARYQWNRGAGRARPFISFAAHWLVLRADTAQTQTYYEGATEALPGTSYTGIDHQISTRQAAVGMVFGLSF